MAGTRGTGSETGSGSGTGGAKAKPDIEAERLASYDVLRLRAENPGPLTLSGTNTWIVDSGPAYVVDPGPALDGHIERIIEAVDDRGGLGGIVLTHDHPDHCEAVDALRRRRPAPLAAGRGKVDVTLAAGLRFGPFEAIATPGHSLDHFALLGDRVCFTGDAVLGEGSVFITPDPGALAGYLDGLAHLSMLDIDVICPGHGPPVWEPYERLEQYIGHRYDREHRLVLALGSGARTANELLDAAWSDVPAELRPLAAASLAAHLDKLADEDLLPDGVERPLF